jgi:transcriptional regulator with XRE-family HTH domain
MALTMRPTGLGSGTYKDDADYRVSRGEWSIGRIHEVGVGPDHLRRLWACTSPASRQICEPIRLGPGNGCTARCGAHPSPVALVLANNALEDAAPIRPAELECEMTTIKTPNLIDKHVGARLRMRRMMLGMSQEKLGEAFGVTFQQVQKYEKGINRMGASRLQHAAQILDVSVPFFFEGAPGGHNEDGDTLSPAYIDDFVSSEDGLRMIKAFTRIRRPAVRHRIVNLVQEIAGGDRE